MGKLLSDRAFDRMNERAGAMPKVSVCMLTYNHEAFIADAVESVLAQQTPFEVELIIGEDCSSDRTRSILLEYQRKFPDRIRLVLQPKRLGQQANAGTALRLCRGEYLAFLEGDDFWTDPLKLQAQVALMDASPTAFMCGARAQLWRMGEAAPSAVLPAEPGALITAHGARGLFEARWWFRTCTQLFRREMMKEMPQRFGGDWLSNMWMIARTNFGEICFLDRVVGVYREHAAGLWSAMPQHGRLAHDIHALHGLIPLFHGADRAQLQRRMLDAFDAMLALPDAPALRVMQCGMLTAARCPEQVRPWTAMVAGARRVWR